MTKFEALQDLLNEKQMVSGIRKQNVRASLSGLLLDGKTSTGSSSWVSKRYGAKKDVWTGEVSAVLTRLGIAHECGNDAPRGGANGEYIQITSPAFLKIVRKNKKEREERWAAEQATRAEAAAMCAKRNEEHEERMKALAEQYREKIESFDIMALVAGQQHSSMLTRRIEKDITHAISDATGIDYQICLWWVRLHFKEYREARKQEYIQSFGSYLNEVVTPEEDKAYAESHLSPVDLRYYRPIQVPQKWFEYFGGNVYTSNKHLFFYERFGIEKKMHFAVNEHACDLWHDRHNNK